MYFPYVRSKQNEVFAIKELCSDLDLSKLIHPIIVPVNIKNLEKRMNSMLSNGVNISLITNPREGSPIPSKRDIDQLLSVLLSSSSRAGKVIPTLEIYSETTPLEIKNFLNEYNNHQIMLVHKDHKIPMEDIATLMEEYRNDFSPIHAFFNKDKLSLEFKLLGSVDKVIIQDGFKRKKKNGLYPSSSDFGNLVFEFKKLGFMGYGDCVTVGDHYSDKGGNPADVALHLTELVGSNIVCNHFVSSVADNLDVEGAYFDALSKLVRYTNIPPKEKFRTKGVEEFILNHKDKKFHQLGFPKRYSIKHHIQMVCNLLNSI